MNSIRQLEVSNGYDEKMLTWMRESEQLVVKLQDAIEAGDVKTTESIFNAMQVKCNNCHSAYRN